MEWPAHLAIVGGGGVTIIINYSLKIIGLRILTIL